MTDNASGKPACPCGTFEHPAVPDNAPGLSALVYRAGDYAAFRRALLMALAGEMSLSRTDTSGASLLWRPATGDLALQMIEWWAYVSDIVTFYSERCANESYLRTAILPENVNRLVRLLGYRPKPALGARGELCALVNRARPTLVPAGLQVQNKPGPGQPPQVFEVDVDTTVGQPDIQPVTAAPQFAASLVNAASDGSASATLLVAGAVSTVKPGDGVMFIRNGFDGTSAQYVTGTLQSLVQVRAPDGSRNTSIALDADALPDASFADVDATHWRLLRSTGSATLYPYLPDTHLAPTGGGPYIVSLRLASIFRQIQPGDIVVVDNMTVPRAAARCAGVVTACTENIFYANNPGDPGNPPSSKDANTPVPAVPVPHTVLTVQMPVSPSGDATTVVMRYGWRDVGTLVNLPATAAGSSAPGVALSTAAPTSTAQAIASVSSTSSGDGAAAPAVTSAFVVDSDGTGSAASVDANGNITLDPAAPALSPPLSVLFNRVPVSRGQSVDETLGSGDGTILNQNFTLQKKPVTYFADPAGRSGDGFSSTVRIWVNGIQWSEVPDFFGQPGDAQVFTTREDEAGNTHVVFGDGRQGARLPTGVNNVSASYRYGAGADAPPPATLVSILQTQPGLASFVNPVAPTGGADADPPERVRTLAPNSVLSFGRAVSLFDFQAIAAAAPGVTAAQAAFAFDEQTQRPAVHVWVAGDAGAADAARNALAGAADSNRPFNVQAAVPVDMVLSLSYVRDARYLDSAVQQALHDALVAPQSGLFGAQRVVIGAPLYDSDIYAACLAVPGVVAVHDLSFAPAPALRIPLPRRVPFPRRILFARGVSRIDVAASRRAAVPMHVSIPGSTLASRLGSAAHVSTSALAPLRKPAAPKTSGAPVAALRTQCRPARYAPGDGRYYRVPDDSVHLKLHGEAAS
ncbi:hypothetical protein G3N95_12080 [Paraburkholderia sp. Tr-20389]|uniref:hypothetical protein n=1 Tax=Paraburkholderia sp. Tr-20389 TaxID=2703903 RepID=UPI00197DD5BB|nr:hypothetical protein [Paraburkholderia sp. Tr-20389]MBN3753680.1 hypothetical protein [Paraburkholderia sp. Tr-20389]